MRIKYIGGNIKKSGYTIKDGATFTRKGEILDVPITKEEINPWVLKGEGATLEIVEEQTDTVEQIDTVKPVKRRGFNKCQ